MTAAQCVNCSLWTVYGLAAAHNVYVWGPNLTGLLLGLMQLALKLCYPAKGNADGSRTRIAKGDLNDEDSSSSREDAELHGVL